MARTGMKVIHKIMLSRTFWIKLTIEIISKTLQHKFPTSPMVDRGDESLARGVSREACRKEGTFRLRNAKNRLLDAKIDENDF